MYTQQNKENVRNFSKVLMDARGLAELQRWPGVFMMGQRKPNVAEHSFYVAQEAIMLAQIEQTEFGTIINWESLFKKVMGHDAPEVYTGDVKGPLKHNYPDIKKSVDQAEVDMTQEELCQHLSPAYADVYLKMMTNGKDGSVEGDILKAADNIDQVIECLIEIRVNNPHKTFITAYTEAIKKLRTITTLRSVKLFLEVTLLELIEDIHYHVDIKELTHKLLANQ